MTTTQHDPTSEAHLHPELAPPVDDAEMGVAPHSLSAHDISLAYDDRVVVDGLTVRIPDGQFTVIVGANACGKSTLLRGLARLLKPTSGAALLDGENIQRMSTKEVARRLGILPQQPIAPEGITVGDLVARGRHPHQ
jgi:iron complex transport system ATP-binding protein